ncbi:hypothetical protein M3A49_01100 [Paraburkholderia sp. CNPSo 3076]|uniref:hypothetical protein n=1 Tax=Paraburkholderia sp. CNPSo 3076 TaxID=2940936 RepID=UPI0022593571|nr:hypothetical protein [Paraburkholderia sp. CNPSo 3076]MCX5538106.1 hypothetical protein [Paraburkholderia sp. CNPSo 3076]
MDFDTFESRAQDLGFPYDAFVLGTGIGLPTGRVDIEKSLSHWYESGHWLQAQMREIDESFLVEYKDKAPYDVVGQLFAAYPSLVQVVSVYEYDELKAEADKRGEEWPARWAGTCQIPEAIRNRAFDALRSRQRGRARLDHVLSPGSSAVRCIAFIFGEGSRGSQSEV